MLLAVALSWAMLSAWMVLYLGRGGFWRSDQVLPRGREPHPGPWPEVTAIVPARNEAGGIAQCVRGILGQEYGGTLRLVVVDDQSQDGTARLALEAAAGMGAAERLTVLSGQALPPGWAGKVWAMAQGVDAAGSPPYFWFTDGDIVHGPAVLERLVDRAEQDGRVLVSLMVRLSCRGFWEHFLIPPFIFFFQKLYPFPWINGGRHQTAGAAGGCMLVRREALEKAGGFAAMRDALIDDCRLAALLRPEGPLWLGHAEDSRSLRHYRRLGEIWSMVARSAYVELGFRPERLAAALLGMVFLYWLPLPLLLLGVLWQAPAVWTPALAALLLSWRLFWPTLRLYGLSPLWMPALQPAAGLYTLMTADSARRHYLGRGGAWKGRTYS